jgi:hypothetical protein
VKEWSFSQRSESFHRWHCQVSLQFSTFHCFSLNLTLFSVFQLHFNPNLLKRHFRRNFTISVNIRISFKFACLFLQECADADSVSIKCQLNKTFYSALAIRQSKLECLDHTIFSYHSIICV